MRIKPKNLYPIPDLKTADEVLRKIAELKRNIIVLESEAQEKIDKIKDGLNSKISPILQEIERYELSLSAFANAQKDELFKDRKTIEITFGFLGFRQSTKISITNQTLKLLKQFGYNEAIIVKESVNKEVLQTYSESQLAEVKAKKIVEDNFWYELKNDVQK
uniref:Host-nuclease inhibitor protein Gam n=1 Tax=candidate division WOR-3 bacterium TaxID=2052148 RepID=A0A7C6A8G9_UNCW3